jgi:hypothetical protein
MVARPAHLDAIVLELRRVVHALELHTGCERIKTEQ